MRRAAVIMAGATTVVAALSGCSGHKQRPAPAAGSDRPSTAPGGSASSGSASSGSVKVIIDGRPQSGLGAPFCGKTGDVFTIAIARSPISVALTDSTPPEVTRVALGEVNGVNLAYVAGTDQGNAEVTQDGKTYTITGIAVGQDVSKPFEIDVTCQ